MSMNPEKTKVILVGNSTFPNWGNEDKSILNADQNIERLQKIFFDNAFFGIPNDQKHLIPILNKTSQEILLEVKHQTKGDAEKDQFERLIFYYCGHGIPGEDKKLFFAAKDTVRADYELTSVDSQRLFSYLRDFGAREVIVILDCCYAAQTRENQGDADSLIEQCLPRENAESEDPQSNGIYYLFAAGKDNVAKFNPKEPKKPTYFTEALLNSINAGTQPETPFVRIGELYKQLCQEIGKLKKTENPDIPDPRPGLEGNVNDFLFCKNIKFENQEDKDWNAVVSAPLLEKIQEYKNTYSKGKYTRDANDLIKRIMNGKLQCKELFQTKDYNKLYDLANEYQDYPEVSELANRFADKLVKELSAIEEDFKQQVLSDKIEKEETAVEKPVLEGVKSEPPGLIRPDKVSSARDQMSSP